MEILGIKFNEFSVADQSISSAPAKLKAEWGYSLATGKYHTSLHIIYPDTGRSMLMLMEGDCQDDFEEFDDIATEFNGDESLPEIWKSSVIEAKQHRKDKV